jgi:hypothetical protein
MAEVAPQTEPATRVLSGRWPSGVQVMIRPGVGGQRRKGGAFAETAGLVYAELKRRGVPVAYAVDDQSPDCQILLLSADWWGPVLLLARDLAIGVSGAAIYDALKYLIVRARKSLGDDMQAHLDIQHLAKRPGADGVVSVQTVSLEGDAETVLRGLRDILRAADEGGGPG